MKPKDLLKNLLAMAASDGAIHQGEMSLLADRCTQWGVSDDEFGEMLELATNGKLALQIPPEPSDRETLLRELVHMMAADGQLADTEKHLFATAAAVMKITPARLDQIIDQAISR
ncbi:MAG: TerB family tellurite resistance protein [Planctomycetota bacterium]|nr:TerB family tellurite resistance protein [Planctomycetota bacterium]MDA1179606.1 TerB family tellurite resistance protein [Planctomycetota bacterium]